MNKQTDMGNLMGKLLISLDYSYTTLCGITHDGLNLFSVLNAFGKPEWEVLGCSSLTREMAER